jgi:hypothetical protein
MTFETFKAKINMLIAKADGDLRVWFSHDLEQEKYYAKISDGTTITGRPGGKKITVRYGSGHQMMAAV